MKNYQLFFLFGFTKLKALILGLIIQICLISAAFGQFNENASGELYFNGGNVGIGDSNPSRLLHLRYNNGNTATSQLYIEQDGSGDAWMNFGLTGGRHYAMGVDNSDGDRFKIGYYYGGPRGVNRNTRLSIDRFGNVGIGINHVPSGYRLAVNGNVICEEVRVELSEEWGDFVFNPDYKLLSLKKLEERIKKLGHLPGMPSADEVKKDGIEVGEINRLLTIKIEELTLYLIEQNKQIEKLQAEVEDLKNK